MTNTNNTTVFSAPTLRYAIADAMGIPNEYIVIDSFSGDIAFLHDSRQPTVFWTVKTVRGGMYMKKNSLRRDN